MPVASRRTPALLAMLLPALLLSGCAGSAPSTSTGPATTGAGGSAAAPPAPPARVTITQAVDTLAFTPAYVARSKGYFQEEGVEADVSIQEGGEAATQAVIGRSAQFALSDSGSVTQPNDKGVNLVSIETVMGKLTLSLTMRADLADQLGVSRGSPLDARLGALKGRTIGITSPGSASEIYTSYYMRLVGLDPTRDAKMVALGGGPSLLAALRQGQIDAFMQSPPTGESGALDGYARLLVSASQGDVPELDSFPYEVLFARKDYLDQNPDVARRVARAVARANNFSIDYPEATREILQTHFPRVKPELMEESVKAILPAIPRDGLATEQGWARAVEIHEQSGMIGKRLESREGALWTNDLLSDLNGMSDR